MKIRLSISTKLIFMVTTIVIVAIGIVVYNARVVFSDEAVAHAQSMNLDVAKSLGEQVRALLRDATEKADLMGSTVLGFKGQSVSEDGQKLILNALKSTDDLVSFGVYKPEGANYKEFFFAAKEEALAEFDLKTDDLKNKPLSALVKAVEKNPDEITLYNSSPLFKKPILSLAFLTKKAADSKSDGKDRWLIRVDLRQAAFIQLFVQHPSVTAYLLDADGNLLIHANPQLVMGNYNYSNFDLVQQFKSSKVPEYQKEFSDGQGQSFLGAYSRTGVGGTAVFTQVDKEHALRAVSTFQYRSMLLTTVVVGLAFILNFIFSKSMTSPLSRLYQATEKIAKGEFNVKLESKAHDEIGALTSAFKKMVSGLQERDKLKTTFNKFHSKEVAEKILSGEIKLGGERKMVTVFFSDIRNFTTMSEEMTPDEVVNMLNEYFTVMVNIIKKHHGVVDKYVGDAIMALWGVPNSSPDDAFHAVTAALEMRRALIQLNKKRRSRGHQEIHIGIGIHTGEVLAGNIGSEERLEYTVIGDSVNQASRIESANKNFSSDLLISDATLVLIKKRGFAFGPAIPIHVKGKHDALTVFHVIGTKDADGNVVSDLSASEQDRIENIHNEKTVAIKSEDMVAAASPASQAAPEAVVPVATQTQTQTPRPGFSSTATAYRLQDQPAQPAVQPVAPPAPGMAVTPHAQSFGSESPSRIFERGDSQVHFTQRPSKLGHPPAPNSQQPPEEQWFLVRNAESPDTEGPYTVSQLRVLASQADFNFEAAFIFRDGDLQMTPISQLPGVSRRARSTMPAINAPLPPEDLQAEAAEDEWYLYGGEDKTFGPYSVSQIVEAVEAGHVTRTTYCWKQGMANWIYVYELPGFDRRDPARSVAAPSPIPVKRPA